MTQEDPMIDIGTLAELLPRRAALHPDRIAFLGQGAPISYAELDRRSRKVAAGLRASGVRHGDRVAYVGRNSADYYELLFGIARLGAVMMPLNWRLADAELEYILDHADVAMLFGEEAHLGRGGVPRRGAEHAIAIDVLRPDGSPYARWRDGHVPEPGDVDIRPNDVAMQLYTSGTTGRPKGAMLSHRNILALRTEVPLAEQLPWYRWTAKDVSILSLPLFHIGTAAWGIIGLHHGGSLVIQPDFDPGETIAAIARHGVTRLALVPSALQMIIEHPAARDADFSSIDYIFYGASPMPLALLRRSMEAIGSAFVQIYGMTETCGSLVALPPEDHGLEENRRMLSAGKPFPGVEVAVKDADARFLPDGQIGEIVIRSPSNMVGYYQQPEETARIIDPDGWLHTGDAGFVEDGYVYVQDRIKEMIITGGENVYPAEVEAAIVAHGAVADVAVIGVPDDRWGEAVKAVVVLAAGRQADEAEIIGWVRSRIAAFKAPKSVDFATSLPRSASGKLLRKDVREPYWAGRERRVN
nr:long-chain-fatty-acid--CoA ligase [Sphingomonas sp. Y57]